LSLVNAILRLTVKDEKRNRDLAIVYSVNFSFSSEPATQPNVLCVFVVDHGHVSVKACGDKLLLLLSGMQRSELNMTVTKPLV